jgi:hypothetical protein
MSDLQSKDTGITEVAILEAIEKAKAGEPVKPGWDRRYAYNSKILGETERGKLHEKIIERKRANVGAA